MDKAWHLRQDGKAFPVKVHIYCMEDEDLSSEAEAAAFIIKTESKDKDIAENLLDAWMALLIEDSISYDSDEEAIEEMIRENIISLPYRFQYPLSESQLISIHRKLKNYTDVDTYYEFIDKVKDNLGTIQEEIKRSLNQQFCRVRHGGKYNSVSGNSEIWFRISSTNYNWANTIYLFASSIKRSYQLSHITICRDNESDNSSKDYFYKAKDGTVYNHMPINEYFEEEHEHSPVFESSKEIGAGYLQYMRSLLNEGETYREALRDTEKEYGSIKSPWGYFIKQEKRKYCI